MALLTLTGTNNELQRALLPLRGWLRRHGRRRRACHSHAEWMATVNVTVRRVLSLSVSAAVRVPFAAPSRSPVGASEDAPLTAK